MRPLGAPILAFACFLACACGHVKTTLPPAAVSPLKDRAAAPAPAVKFKVQVVSFGVDDEVAHTYPELADKKIGMGLCNRVVESLYDTRWFEFLEEKPEIVKRVLDQWGKAVNQDEIYEWKASLGQMKVPDFLIYAEVYEFSVGRSRSAALVAGSGEDVIRMGIQVRMVSVETGQFIPASGVGESRYESDRQILFATTRSDFEQSGVGRATDTALQEALAQLLKRIQASGLKPSQAPPTR